MDTSKPNINLSPKDAALIQKCKTQNGIYGELVIYFSNAQNVTDFEIIKQSVDGICSITGGGDTYVQPTGVVKNGLREFALKIRNEVIVKDFLNYGIKATNILGSKALRHMEKYCFTIIMKSNILGRNISRQEIFGENCTIPYKGELKLNLTEYEANHMKEQIKLLFEEYIDSTSPDHLVFDTQFTEHERKTIGKIASLLHKLEAISYGDPDGKHGDRKLVISKRFYDIWFNNPWELLYSVGYYSGHNIKKWDKWDLVELLLINNCETRSYKLIKPTQVS